MINIYLYDRTLEKNGELTYLLNNKWVKMPENGIAKFTATLIKIDAVAYSCEKVTIIKGSNIVDIFIDGSFQELIPMDKVTKRDIQKIKKVRNFYRRKFQFGMEYSMLDILFEAEQAVIKYKLLKKHKLYFKEVNND